MRRRSLRFTSCFSRKLGEVFPPLFLRVVPQVTENRFPSFARIQNALKLACHIGNGGEIVPEEEQPRSFRGAARGCSRAWARGANTVSRAAGPLLRRGPHSATLRKALHAHKPRRGRVPWYHHLKTLNPAFLVHSGPCRLRRGFWP